MKDFEIMYKDEVLTKLKSTSKEQKALNRIIRNRTQGDELQGDEFWLLQQLIDKSLWENRYE